MLLGRALESVVRAAVLIVAGDRIGWVGRGVLSDWVVFEEG